MHDLPEDVEQAIRDDGRYPPEAYAFLHEGLARAAKDAYETELAEGGQHHVSGQELCEALRDQAIERWGMLARTVLAKWNINTTIDFGQMVYLLIEHDYMRKTPEDSLEDFRDVYGFDEAFPAEGQFELKE